MANYTLGQYNHKINAEEDWMTPVSSAGVEPVIVQTPLDLELSSITEEMFIDGFEDYGFLFLTSEVLALKEGRMLFVLASKKTLKLEPSMWISKDLNLIVHYDKSKVVKQFTIGEFIGKFDSGARVDDDSGGSVLADKVKAINQEDFAIEVETEDGKKSKIDLYKT